MLADVTRMGEWSPECLQCRWLDGAAGPGVGARFEGRNRLPFAGTWTSTSTIVSSVPGRELSWVVGRNSDDPNTRWEYLLAPAGTGTDVTERYEMLREPWVVRLYYRIARRQRHLERTMAETLRRLKEAAERAAAEAS